MAKPNTKPTATARHEAPTPIASPALDPNADPRLAATPAAAQRAVSRDSASGSARRVVETPMQGAGILRKSDAHLPEPERPLAAPSPDEFERDEHSAITPVRRDDDT